LLDLLLLRVRQLPALAVEELHAVVLRRIVGGGDDRADVLGKERDCRRGEHTREDRGPTRADDAAGERLLERRARRAGVPADEYAATSRPQRHGFAETLDELRRQVVAEDSANAVSAKVPPRHGGGTYLF